MNETLLTEDNSPLSLDPQTNYLNELVGEQKKFKTPEDLARGKYESDLYIETLTKRLDTLREDYLKVREENIAKAKLEELIDKAQFQKLSMSNEPVKEDKMPEFDPRQIESLVDTRISKLEVERKEQTNFNIVKEKLKERFGSNYQTHLKQQIDTLGLTEEDVNALARKSPNAFLRTMGLDQPVQQDNFQAPPRNQIRSDNFRPTTQKRTWSYYEDMRKTDPKKYHDPKTTLQMHEDYAQLGREFEDGDPRLWK